MLDRADRVSACPPSPKDAQRRMTDLDAQPIQSADPATAALREPPLPARPDVATAADPANPPPPVPPAVATATLEPPAPPPAAGPLSAAPPAVARRRGVARGVARRARPRPRRRHLLGGRVLRERRPRRQARPPRRRAAAASGPDAELALIDQAWRDIQNNYVDAKNLDYQALAYGAIRGMTDAVGDSGHTSFMTADEVKASDQSLSGTFIGIGVQLSTDQRQPGRRHGHPRHAGRGGGTQARGLDQGGEWHDRPPARRSTRSWPASAGRRASR